VRRSKGFVAAVSVLAGVASILRCGIPAAVAAVSQSQVVSEDPSDTTPHIVLGATGEDMSVYAFAQIGKTVYAGGRFDQVQSPDRSVTYSRENFFAFNSQTGAVSALHLSFSGLVTVVTASADGKALFIGGSFKTVNGLPLRALIKYDLVKQQIDPTFQPTSVNGATVGDAQLVGSSLIVAGSFSKKLVALNTATGADTGAINITVAGAVDPSDVTRVRNIAVSPNGTRLVATGNFATVNGQSHKRAFMLNLGAPSTLSTWHAPRFDVACDVPSRRVSAQGVDFSPHGSYFVIVATGGPSGTSGICDAAARFETANVSNKVEPTWINWPGGDSLWSVAITGAAVYVGGHQRWLDNPLGHDSAGPGAVSRPGIGAIDPSTGKALAWNPTKSRDHGTVELYATTCGLWVGSDGPLFGGEYHAGIAYTPLPGTTTGCVPAASPK